MRMVSEAGIILLVMLLSSTVCSAQPALPESEAIVRVQSGRVQFRFPLPTRTNSQDVGLFRWKVSIQLPLGEVDLLIAADSTDFREQLKEQVKSVTILRCSKHAAGPVDCERQENADFRLGSNSLFLDVTDRTLLDLIRESRPQSFWRYWSEPSGRFGVDKIELVYK